LKSTADVIPAPHLFLPLQIYPTQSTQSKSLSLLRTSKASTGYLDILSRNDQPLNYLNAYSNDPLQLIVYNLQREAVLVIVTITRSAYPFKK